MKLIANLLPRRLCYWVLIRVGIETLGGPEHPDEVVPDVPFVTALSRW